MLNIFHYAAFYAFIIFIIEFVLAIFGLKHYQDFGKYIQKKHPDLWESLGHPHWMRMATGDNWMRWYGWLWAKEYLDIGDPVVRSLGDTMRRDSFLFICFGLALIILPIVGVLFFGLI